MYEHNTFLIFAARHSDLFRLDRYTPAADAKYYKGLVRRLQRPCTDATKALYEDYKALVRMVQGPMKNTIWTKRLGNFNHESNESNESGLHSHSSGSLDYFPLVSGSTTNLVKFVVQKNAIEGLRIGGGYCCQCSAINRRMSSVLASTLSKSRHWLRARTRLCSG